MNDLQFSQDAIDIIKRFEGLRLESYKDPIGIWTIGYGTTANVKPKMIITEGVAEKLLIDHMVPTAKYLNNVINVELMQSEFDALMSFVYNIGSGRFAESTMLKLINHGDLDGAADEFPKWRKAGGIVLPGLVARRAAEQALFKRDRNTLV